MSECESLNSCPFFQDKMSEMPTTANMLKKRYCLGDNSACARYMVFKALGKEMVPTNLYPHMQDKANEILSFSRKSNSNK